MQDTTPDIYRSDREEGAFEMRYKDMTDGLEAEKKEQKRTMLQMLLLAFTVPAALMLVVYICIGAWPFGPNSVLVLDLNGQYIYFFEELHNIIYEGKSILWSWERSLGGEFMGMYAYYLASPLSWLVALLPSSWIVESLFALLLLKTGLAGSAMAYYLHRKRKTKVLNVVLFSTLYAMCAYSVNYLHNTMWMDAFLLLPLLTLGIEELVSGRRFILYTAVLAITVISNYYIGYMICLYVIIYFFYYHIACRKDATYNEKHESAHFLRSLGRIGVFSALAIAISACVLLPAVYSLTFGKTTFTDPTFSFKAKFDIVDFLFKLFPGATDTVRREGLPFIYCGTVTLFLIPCFFCAKKIKIREKVAGAIILFLFFVFMSIPAFDLIWHGGQEPNWLNYRYSFIFSFLLITLAYRAFEYLGEFTGKFLFAVGAFLGIVLVLIQQKQYSANYEYSETFWYDYDITVVYLGFAFLGLALLGLFLYKRNTAKRAGTAALCAVVFAEALLSGGMHHVTLAMDCGYSTRASYLSFMSRCSAITDYISEKDDSFYRMDKTFYRQPADDAALGMRGLSSTTSTLNKYTLAFLDNMGYNSSSYWSCYSGGNPVGDSLLGLKYIIDDDSRDPLSALYEKLISEKSIDYSADDNGAEAYTAAFYNKYALSLAYAVDSSILGIDCSSYNTPFELLNDTVSAMTGNRYGDMYIAVPSSKPTASGADLTSYTSQYIATRNGENARVTLTFTAPESTCYYIYIPSSRPKEALISLNGNELGSIMGNSTDSIVFLGKIAANTECTVTLTMTEETSKLYLSKGTDYVYYLDGDAFSSAFEELAENQLTIDGDYKEDRITGTVNVPNDNMVLYTTIPYDRGWRITVDGKPCEAYTYTKTTIDEETGETVEETLPCADALIALPIERGSHTVSFVYMPDCVMYGVTVSAGGIFLFGIAVTVYLLVERRKKKRRGDISAAIRESAIAAELAERAIFSEDEAENDYDRESDSDS